MGLEVGSEQGVVLTVEPFYVLKLPSAWNLLRKYAMQFGLDAMSLDRRGDQPEGMRSRKP